MVRSVASGGKFYWLPPDKENTGNMVGIRVKEGGRAQLLDL